MDEFALPTTPAMSIRCSFYTYNVSGMRKSLLPNEEAVDSRSQSPYQRYDGGARMYEALVGRQITRIDVVPGMGLPN